MFIKTKELFNKMLNLRDCPYKLASSFSLGFGMAFLPLPGINVIISVVLAKLLKLSVVAAGLPGLLLTYVSPFLYILNYKVGTIFIANGKAYQQPHYIDYEASFIDRAVDFFANLGAAYLLGSVINALIAATVAYFVFFFFFKNNNKLLAQKNSEARKIKIKQRTTAKNKTIFIARIKNLKKLPGFKKR